MREMSWRWRRGSSGFVGEMMLSDEVIVKGVKTLR